jgi:hypothetical protein
MIAELEALEKGLIDAKQALKQAGEKEASATKACKEIEAAMKSNVNEVSTY